MDRTFAFLCDAAQESGGKLHALGIGINRVFGTETPVTVGRLVAVAQLQYTAAEAGPKHLNIRTVDADGGNVIEPQEATIVFPDVRGALRGVANIIVQLERPQFPSFGAYEISVAIDGSAVATLPIEVVRREAPQQPPQPASP